MEASVLPLINLSNRGNLIEKINHKIVLFTRERVLDKEIYLTLKKRLALSRTTLGRDDYLNTAVFVPLVFRNTEYYFLFEKRAINIPQGNEICFPGGVFDPEKDKVLRDTAIRETEEEIGIDRKKIIIEGQCNSVIAPMGAIIDVFIGVLDIAGPEELDINVKEVEKVILIPVSYFMENEPDKFSVYLEIKPSYFDENGKETILLPAWELGLPGRYHKPWKSKNHQILVYKWKDEKIWGITAKIVHEIVKFLKGPGNKEDFDYPG